MTDLVFTHITAKLPGSNAFLINPYGMLFDEITASSLVKVDDKCNKIEVSLYRVASIMLRHLRMLSFSLQASPHPVNPAGFNIHAAVHAARHDAGALKFQTPFVFNVSKLHDPPPPPPPTSLCCPHTLSCWRCSGRIAKARPQHPTTLLYLARNALISLTPSLPPSSTCIHQQRPAPHIAARHFRHSLSVVRSPSLAPGRSPTPPPPFSRCPRYHDYEGVSLNEAERARLQVLQLPLSH
jgi:hypothetical protein